MMGGGLFFRVFEFKDICRFELESLIKNGEIFSLYRIQFFHVIEFKDLRRFELESLIKKTEKYFYFIRSLL